MNFPPSKPVSFLDMGKLTAYLTICRWDCNLSKPAGTWRVRAGWPMLQALKMLPGKAKTVFSLDFLPVSQDVEGWC
jgi:hypothetical protein